MAFLSVIGFMPGLLALFVFLVLTGLKVVREYERGVKFTLGKYSGLMQPGLRLVIPIIQSWERVDLRVKAVDVPDQDCISKDNVSVRVNAVLYFKVADPKKAIIDIENYYYATSQLSQTTMRDVVGEVTLDDLLRERDKISKKIQMSVDKATDPWGIKAESEREKRAVIIKAEGEAEAATNMAKAARTLATAPGALHLRTLQSINEISSDQSNTVVFAVPLEVLRALEGLSKGNK